MADAAATLELAEEDELRARWYALIGATLRAAPDQARLDSLAHIIGDESDLGQRAAALGRASARAGPKALVEEYFDLFIGIGRGELLPFGSYYLAGFLYEKPLADLRGDMRQLGIAQAEEVKVPEDHIASLMEMMSGLITGAFGSPADLATQRRFFTTHLGSWAPRFFEDLERASSADFYKEVGRIGSAFVAIEAQAFDMAA